MGPDRADGQTYAGLGGQPGGDVPEIAVIPGGTLGGGNPNSAIVSSQNLMNSLGGQACRLVKMRPAPMFLDAVKRGGIGREILTGGQEERGPPRVTGHLGYRMRFGGGRSQRDLARIYLAFRLRPRIYECNRDANAEPGPNRRP